jgi:hypothetical protein
VFFAHSVHANLTINMQLDTHINSNNNNKLTINMQLDTLQIKKDELVDVVYNFGGSQNGLLVRLTVMFFCLCFFSSFYDYCSLLHMRPGEIGTRIYTCTLTHACTHVLTHTLSIAVEID